MKGSYWLLAVIIALGLYYAGRYLYFKPRYSAGQQAPTFLATLLNGENFSLDDLHGRYVLLDFWGSWCGPCRQENPVLVQIYEKYRGEPFEVVSVAVENSRDRWENAIQRDGLAWKYHIGQFEDFKSPIAKLYGVREIPTKYLINPEGDIIAVNPGLVEVDEILSEQL